MSGKLLVTYGSRKGSTAEIATRIAFVLHRKGRTVDILEADEVKDLSGYSSVILGTSLYAGFWHKHASEFLRRYAQELAGKDVYIFVSGPAGDGDPNQLLDGAFYPQSLKPYIDEIKPRDIAAFGGKIDAEKLNVLERFIIRKAKSPEGDYRNWTEIEAWALKTLQPEAAGVQQ